MKFRHVLIVHQAPMIRNLVRGYLLNESTDIKTVEAENAEEALLSIEHQEIDVVLLGSQLGGDKGIKIIEHLKAQGRVDRVVTLYSGNELENKAQLESMGVRHFLQTPFQAKELIALVNHIADPRKLRAHERFNVEGVTSILQSGGKSLEGRVLNLSEKAFLAEFHPQGEMFNLIALESLAIRFPKEYGGVLFEGLEATLSKLHVTERDAGGNPLVFRAVWLYTTKDDAQQSQLDQLFDSIATDLDLMHNAMM